MNTCPDYPTLYHISEKSHIIYYNCLEIFPKLYTFEIFEIYKCVKICLKEKKVLFIN